MTERKTPDINVEYPYYHLTKQGPRIDARKGRGKTLALLLQHEGYYVRMFEIEGVSKWKHPTKRMEEFAKEINLWSKHYQISAHHKPYGDLVGYKIQVRE